MMGISISNGAKIFQYTPFKDIRILRKNGGREKNDVALCI